MSSENIFRPICPGSASSNSPFSNSGDRANLGCLIDPTPEWGSAGLLGWVPMGKGQTDNSTTVVLVWGGRDQQRRDKNKCLDSDSVA